MKYLLIAMMFIFISCDDHEQDQVCGDNIIQGTEECDGYDRGDLSCEDFGYCGGVIMCYDDCKLSLGNCQQYPCDAAGESIIKGEVNE